MKFKKTKLTALALSVLMAASTITSVTWAADLFTDGAEAEVVVEAPAEIISDVEEVESADDVTLLSRDLTGVEIKSAYENTSKQMVVEFWPVYDNNGKKEYGTLQTAIGQLTKDQRSATCTYPQQAVYSFEYEKKTYYTDYVPMVGGEAQKDHDYVEISVMDTDRPGATCETEGYAFTYEGCTYCKKARDGVDYREKLTDLQSIWKQYQGKEDPSKVMVKEVKVAKTGHLWDTSYKTVVPLQSTYDASGKEKKVEPTVDAAKLAYYENEANCRIVNQEVTGPIDDTKDAYYYVRHKCKNAGCDKVEDIEKVTFYYANMRENEVLCIGSAVNNIKSFVTVDADGFLVSWEDEYMNYKDKEGKLLYTSLKIPLEKCKGAILADCTKNGSYSVISRSVNGTITEKEVAVGKGHTFSNVMIDEDNAKTEKGKLLTDETKVNALHPERKYVVDYDENKDVVKAYSNSCEYKAKYQLYHYCLNDNCAKSEAKDGEEVGTQKITDKGTVHTFAEWKLDPTKTVYTKIDEKQHKEHYIDTSKCLKCGKVEERASVTPDAVKDHTLAAAEIKDTRIDATCGENGSYKRGYTCACGYVDEDSITTVTIPSTDKHDFGTNEAFITWTGEVFVSPSNNVAKRSMHAYVVRKCNVCGKLDSNGINGEKVTAGGGNLISAGEKVVLSSIVDAKKDPATGVTYTCSTAHATLKVDWLGTVDGNVVKLNDSNSKDATKENVPYYASLEEYQGRTAHQAGPVVKENIIAPTDTADGSYDEVIYCNVCGDEMSRKTTKVSKLDPAVVLDTPVIVSAVSTGYNSVKVTWNAVEGAVSYRLYYRGGDATGWTRVKSGIKGTTYTYTSSNLVSGVKYRFTVRAVSGDVLSGYSAKGKVAAPKPAAPTMKSVAFSGKKATVTWSKVVGANGYIIQRKTTGGWSRVGIVKSGSKVTWTDKKAVSGASYRVRAYRTVENVNVHGPFSVAK